jgi:hypothetical protein
VSAIVYPHRIRLRGPWECEPLARSDGGPLPPPRRMTLPCRWGEAGLPDFAGRVRFRRRFGYPGRIDTYERVWLTFAGVEGTAAAWLNGQLLGPQEGTGPFEFEVTSLLGQRNELMVEVDAPGGDGGLWGEVALEVRCTAYLRGGRVWITEEGRPDLHAAGEVVGTAERPLDLYVIRERSTVAYTTVEAAPEGRQFHLVAEGVSEEVSGVRIELVNGATVWFVWEGEV